MQNLKKAFFQVLPITGGLVVAFSAPKVFKANFTWWPDFAALVVACIIGGLAYTLILTPIAYLILRWRKMI